MSLNKCPTCGNPVHNPCEAVIGDDIQSGPIYCGKPSKWWLRSRFGSGITTTVNMCEYHYLLTNPETHNANG